MAIVRDKITGQPRGPLALPHLPALTTTPQRRPDCCLSLSTTLLQAILSHVQHATTHSAAASSSISTSSASPPPPPSSATSQDEWTEGPDNSRGSAGPSEHHQDTIVSIGSGSGLLEACLQRHIDEGHRPSSPSSSLPSSPRPLPTGTSQPAALSVVGVEVNQLTPFPSSYSPPTQQQQQQGLNRYLPPHKREFVKGTWEMWPGSSPALGDDKDNDNDNDVSSDDSGGDDDPLRVLVRHSQDDELPEAGEEGAKPRGHHHTSPRHAEELSRRRRRRHRCRPIALMFVYPRLPALVRKYVDVVSSASSPLSTVRTIIYLGPRVDWLDFKPCFQHSDEDGSRSEIKVLAGEQVGLLEYEMMAVVRIR